MTDKKEELEAAYGESGVPTTVKPLEQSFADWESYVFGFGYGTGEAPILACLKQFFHECRDRHGTGGAGYDYEELETVMGAAQAWFVINALCHADIIEYGSSPRFAWLTDQGLRLKKFIDSKSVEELYDITAGAPSDYIPCYPDACNCGPDDSVRGLGCVNPFWKAKGRT